MSTAYYPKDDPNIGPIQKLFEEVFSGIRSYENTSGDVVCVYISENFFQQLLDAGFDNIFGENPKILGCPIHVASGNLNKHKDIVVALT